MVKSSSRLVCVMQMEEEARRRGRSKWRRVGIPRAVWVGGIEVGGQHTRDGLKDESRNSPLEHRSAPRKVALVQLGAPLGAFANVAKVRSRRHRLPHGGLG